LCRRLDESAGKRKSTRTRKGACWLKTVLVQAAWAAVRTKNSYYRAQFLRLRARRGPKKAIVAVAASMLTAIYYILRDGVEYRELGGQYFERLDRTKATQRLVKRLETLATVCNLRKSRCRSFVSGEASLPARGETPETGRGRPASPHEAARRVSIQ
jgi:Transposase IS116/IS110/IS902 family